MLGMNEIKVDRWSVSHAYNRLVRVGLVPPLTGAEGVELVLRANAQLEPCYWNSIDDTIMTPGLSFWLRLRDAVDQAELDSLV